MNNQIGERFAEHLLYETPEGADITQLENMTGLSRKIISILEKFDWLHQESPDAAAIMNYLKKEIGISDEEIILNNIINILKYKKNDTTIGKYGKEKKSLINMKIYNYCTTLTKGYENLLEEISNTKENISETFETAEDKSQLSIEFPEED